MSKAVPGRDLSGKGCRGFRADQDACRKGWYWGKIMGV